ncbi:MAG: hypothetical protein L0287_18715, partial [Anaerolineae bacterium]|nr:hypothetical protein [Anaerolineae bacterium]
VEVTTDTSCTAIRAVPQTDSQIDGSTHQFTVSSASNPPVQTQSNANYVTFGSIVAGSYTLVTTLPSGDWVLARSCWSSSGGSQGEGSSYNLTANETLVWDIGYTLRTAWVQTENGNVYASGTLRSYIPESTTERLFTLAGDGSAGVITYGVAYDFDANSGENGEAYISTDRWNVNAIRTNVDYYDFFIEDLVPRLP